MTAIARVCGSIETAELVELARSWLATGDVPPRFAFALEDEFRPETFSSAFRARDAFIREFGFAIPCAEALEAAAGLAPLVEVGAGTGFWSALLHRRAVDCIPTDPAIGFGQVFKHGKYAAVVRVGAKTAARRWPERNLLMVWPTYDKTWARQCLKAMRVGRRIAIVTEGDGGCCADDGFFEALENCFVHERLIRLPQFPGIHDRLEIFRKKRPWRRTSVGA
jgi:hypothetical protein